MGLTASDVRFFFSGGLTNNDPDASLGGEISAFWLTTKRLFSDISPDEAEDGKTDYRCIYVNNVSEEAEAVLFNAGFFLENQVEGGGTVTVGTIIGNERQDVIVTNGTLVSGGNFILRYYNLLTEEWTNFQVDWAASLSSWADNFEIAIRALTGLETVTVTPSSSGSTVTFRIDFLGNAAYRYHEAIQWVSSTIDFTTVSAVVTPAKINSGGPIMLTADEISSDVVPPNNISFSNPTIDNPIAISDLKPGEYFPVWIKRVVDSSTIAIEGDGFRLRLRGEIAVS
jgi:hypothetical protein